MKPTVLLLLAVLAAAAVIAGCTSAPVVKPAETPAAPVTTVTTATPEPTPLPQPSFSLGDAYLQRQYTFDSEEDVVVEQFVVDNPSWGIDFTIKRTLNDNLNYCWFTMDVSDVNSEQVNHYGFGREFSTDLQQKIPMYKSGPYKITMKGNRVVVVVTAAKRLP